MPIIVDPGATNPPAPVQVTSPDGILTATVDADHAGVLLEADFSTLDPAPKWVRFERDDGTLVSSGNDARSPGGYAVAYDHQAPLGVAVAWQAIPIGADGTLGTPSQQVAIQTTGIQTTPKGHPCLSVWVKSIDNPGLSLCLAGVEPLPVFTRAPRTQLQTVPGTPFPAGAINVAGSVETQLNFITTSTVERHATEALLTAGVLLIQWDTSFGEDDRYYLLSGDLARTPFARMDTRQDLWAVGITEVARPPTIDAPLFIPGRSYDDATAAAATYDTSTQTWPTYQDAWRP